MNTLQTLKIEDAHQEPKTFYIGNLETFELSDKLIGSVF